MTVNELIAELQQWAESRGDTEVQVVTPHEDETGPIGDDATVLSVAVGVEHQVLLTVG